MGKIRELFAVPVKVTINGQELIVHPFSLGDLASMGMSDLNNITPEQSMILIKRILKQNYPDADESEIEDFPIVHLPTLLAAVEKANNVDTMPDAEKALIEKIKARNASKTS